MERSQPVYLSKGRLSGDLSMVYKFLHVAIVPGVKGLRNPPEKGKKKKNKWLEVKDRQIQVSNQTHIFDSEGV